MTEFRISLTETDLQIIYFDHLHLKLMISMEDILNIVLSEDWLLLHLLLEAILKILEIHLQIYLIIRFEVPGRRFEKH